VLREEFDCGGDGDAGSNKTIDKRVHLSKIGNIAFRYWDDIPNHSASVGLDAFVIMPNYLHGIAIIKALDGPRREVGRSSPNPL
jgi:hypothetical protein